MKSDLVDLDMVYHHETDAALLVSIDGMRTRAVWLPKRYAEITDDSKGNETSGSRWLVVTLPQWLAKEKGLV